MLTYITNECMGLDKMVARVQKQNPGDDSYLLVKKAYEFAQRAHSDQMRKSGEPYFMHPVSVASILTDLMIDPPTIAAGFCTIRWRTAAPWMSRPSARSSARRSRCWWTG